jgi:hypothetical protein
VPAQRLGRALVVLSASLCAAPAAAQELGPHRLERDDPTPDPEPSFADRLGLYKKGIREGVNHGPRIDVTLGRLDAFDAALADVVGFTVGLDAAGVMGRRFGLAIGYGVATGFNGSEAWWFDGRVQLGPGFKIDDRLMVMATLGIGGDSIGGADAADAYTMDLAGYWLGEARVRVNVDDWGAELALARLSRGDIEGNAALDAPREVRAILRGFREIDAFEVTVGAVLIDFHSARYIGGVASFGF